MLIRIPDEVIELGKSERDIDERMKIYGAAIIYKLEGKIIDPELEEILDPNKRRSEKMKGKQNRLLHTKNKTVTDLKNKSVTDLNKTVTVLSESGEITVQKPEQNKSVTDLNEALAIYISNNMLLYDIVSKYIHNNITYGSIAYQIKKQGEEKYIVEQMKEAERLIKKVGLDTFRTILNYIYQDEFWSKQILSISKLNRKNKEGVPYYIVMMDKIKHYTPKVVSIPTV